MIPVSKIWLTRQKDNTDNTLNELNLPSTIITILKNRNINNISAAEAFLNPDLKGFHDPFLLKGMDIAVERINKAIENNEKITIYGDYDVDGITSTSCLYLFLKELDVNVTYYIPDRLKEGYGLNKEALKNLKESGTNLVITVDTGIAAVNEARYAKEIQLDIIITDHHECQDEIPEAISVVDPKQSDCNYPFDMLAGVGVTFKLIHAIAISREDIQIDKIWKYMDIVAIGTVADIVPLVDENRIITRLAFKTIPNTWNIGLQELLNISQYKEGQKITAGFIGFRLAPRLNAGGRMGNAARGVELFTTNDAQKARELAIELNKENSNRQELEEKIYNEAIEKIESIKDFNQQQILVVASENWHHGVIGIVSSKITEKYYRPSILLCIEEDVATGSARSIEGFNIFDALCNCKQLFNKFGGHEMAAGLSINIDKIEELRELINNYANNIMTKEILTPKLKVDMELPIESANLSLLDYIEQLEPYGMGNPEPQFILKGEIEQLRLIGQNNKHLKIQIKDKGLQLDGVGFNMSEYYPLFDREDSIEILCSLSINEWNNRKQVQMMLKDVKYNTKIQTKIEHSINKYEEIKTNTKSIKEWINSNKISINSKNDWAQLYQLLNRFEKENKNIIYIHNILSKNTNEIQIITSLLMLDVFLELKIINYTIHLPFVQFNLIKDKKVKLEDSSLYRYICNN